MKFIKVLTVSLVCLTGTNCFASVEGLGAEIEEVTNNLNFEIEETSSEDFNLQIQLFIQTQLEMMSDLEKNQDQKNASTPMLY